MDENLSGLDKQEEAHFYLTIADFCNLVDKYGLDFIASKSDDLRLQLIQYLSSSDDDDEIDFDEYYVEEDETED